LHVPIGVAHRRWIAVGTYLIECERLGKVLIVVLCGSCEWHACDWGSRLWSVYWKLLQCIMLA